MLLVVSKDHLHKALHNCDNTNKMRNYSYMLDKFKHKMLFYYHKDNNKTPIPNILSNNSISNVIMYNLKIETKV